MMRRFGRTLLRPASLRRALMRSAPVLGGVGLLGTGAGQCHASIILELNSAAPVAVSPGVFEYPYEATLNPDQNLASGDFFVIRDFSGLITGSNSQPANFMFAAPGIGPVPPSVPAGPNNPDIPDLVWTYTGPAISPPSPVSLGRFAASSSVARLVPGLFAAQGTLDSGMKVGNIGVVSVPVPEPSTIVLVGIGVPFLVYLVRRYNAKL